MILFDCERMKHSDTGLFHFCMNLAKALIAEADKQENIELGFYLPRNMTGFFGPDVKVKKVGHFDRAFLFDPKVDLWHISTQLSRYQPLNGRKILTIHDLNFLYEPLTESQKTRRRKLMEKNLRRTSAIVAISRFTKDDILRNIDVGDTPVEVIYNGCNRYDGVISRPEDAPVRPFLFAVGTVLPKKNFHVLPAILRGNDYELYIGGIFDSPAYVERIMAEAKRWGVADRVHLLGSVPESEKHWYLSHCDAFLHPSLAEGFGLPVIEAMQYGKPVFISDHTSLPEVGGDVAYYFNHDFDPDAMRGEFEAGMADFGKGAINPATVRARAMSFSWGEAARRHIDLYRRVLGS